MHKWTLSSRSKPFASPMNTRILLATALAVCIASTALHAQTPVSTGVIQAVNQQEGTLTLRANQPLAAPLVFHGMSKAKIETTDGKVATLADLVAGASATVHYAQNENRWYVSRVIINNPAAATGTTATAEAAGTAAATTTSRAATDDDITTRPGQGAAGDITVQPPGRNAARDGDITTEPASTSTAIRNSGGQ
jgi:hypothetical protein